MTHDNKVTIYWTVGGLAALVGLVVLAWALGVLVPEPVTQ